jgi:hypothetical protein
LSQSTPTSFLSGWCSRQALRYAAGVMGHSTRTRVEGGGTPYVSVWGGGDTQDSC